MKKSLLTVLGVIVVGAAGAAWIATRAPSSSFDAVAASGAPSDDLLAHGEYVARLADCVACHTTPEGKPFAGGLKMGTPLGAIFTTNITPDPETGIGNYSLADFDRAIRHGVAADGHRLYPAMPYPSYEKMSDDDVKALYAYFMSDVEPVVQANKASEIEWPLNMRWPLAFWNVVFTDGGVYQAKTSKDEMWNRGAYLVQGPGHCGSCHTPRGVVMNEKALDESGPEYLSGAVLDGWYAPSLRNDPNVGLGRWSEDDIYAYLKNGRNQHGVVFGSMVEAFNNSTQFMTDNDLKSIAHYLKSLPANAESTDVAWSYDPATADDLSKDVADNVPGARTYAANCAFCHGRDGRGKNEWIPPLAGVSSMLTPQAESAINVTLNGSMRVVSNGVPDAYRMPPYREHLSDQQMADVLTYARSAWGNTGDAVTAEEVAKLRSHTDPASIDVIILQMR
ncbi:alcohol dehydrogenase [Thalassospira profundimaris]|uniref:Alcohol dehydrogenase n=1 Tax=Thalassospira profundimaris TaxID=502049 RepID=A0A367XJ12_9PROT|nr:cytochrome c [Thalassospira profundimaris]RCK53656.1 alcohol dehydrogenase [Thalassospira profundimaris]